MVFQKDFLLHSLGTPTYVSLDLKVNVTSALSSNKKVSAKYKENMKQNRTLKIKTYLQKPMKQMMLEVTYCIHALLLQSAVVSVDPTRSLTLAVCFTRFS